MTYMGARYVCGNRFPYSFFLFAHDANTCVDNNQCFVDLITMPFLVQLDRLRKLSASSGITVIAGTGACVGMLEGQQLPLKGDKLVAEYAKHMHKELLVGVKCQDGSTPIRAGFIGEIEINVLGSVNTGTSDKYISDDQICLLQGAARAMKLTGAPLLLSFVSVCGDLSRTDGSSLFELAATHAVKRKCQLHALHILASEWSSGFSPVPLESQRFFFSKIVICRLESQCGDGSSASEEMNFLRHLVKNHGVSLAFAARGGIFADSAFGDGFAPMTEMQSCGDAALVRTILTLSKEGFSESIFLSNGVYFKMQLTRFGGFGFTRLPQQFISRLLHAEYPIDALDLNKITISNARRLFAWWILPPQALPPKEYGTCSVCKKQYEKIEGKYFEKFRYSYCSRPCLKTHSLLNWKEL